MFDLSALLQSLGLGFSVAADPMNILFCFIGCMVGTMVGVLPGLGPTATMAILLPFTYTLSPVTGLITLAGIYYGAQYGGSTTSILLRLPGDAAAVVTTLDGYAMTQKGRGGAALAISACGSFFAGTVGVLFMALFAPMLVSVVLKFGAPEYFMLMMVGLIASIVLAQGSVVRALAMIMLGLLLGTVGTDVNSGLFRFTFGTDHLVDGMPLLPLVVGLFGVADILVVLERTMRDQVVPKIGKISSLFPNREEIRRAIPASIRGTIAGLFLGLLPGGGALLSSFVSYSLEKRLSRHPETFGKGDPAGVAAPESANNSGAQTAFLPLLTLGIPSNAVMAIMAGAMYIHGIVPGPRIMTSQPGLFWGLIASMWIGNLMLLVINLPLVGMWVQLLKVRYRILYPIVLVVSLIGIFGTNYAAFDVFLTAVFGLLGYMIHKWRCEPAPLILAFVLGPMVEEYFRRSMLVARGDITIFIDRPICLAMLLLTIAMLISIAAPYIRNVRNEAFQEE